MGEKSLIQWTDRTWNPWQGCAKVSEGCDACYMFRDKVRYGQDPTRVVRSAPPTFNAPHKWQREAQAAGRTDLVFTCSWSDWFIRDADAWRPEAYEVIKACPNLVFQILTKRHGRIKQNLPPDWGLGYPNVLLGVSVEDQKTAEQRVLTLLRAPARAHFLSMEPLLGPVDLRSLVMEPRCTEEDGCGEPVLFDVVDRAARCGCTVEGAEPLVAAPLSWVIVGGESGGREAREMDLAWVRALVAQCRDNEIPVFVKQLGSVWARKNKARDAHGGDPSEWPEDLRVREWPSIAAPARPLVQLAR